MRNVFPACSVILAGVALLVQSHTKAQPAPPPKTSMTVETTIAVPTVPQPMHPAAAAVVQNGVNQFFNGTPPLNFSGLDNSAVLNSEVARHNATAAEINTRVANQNQALAERYAASAVAHSTALRTIQSQTIASSPALHIPSVVFGGPSRVVQLIPSQQPMPAGASRTYPNYGKLLAEIQRWLQIYAEISCNAALKADLASKIESARSKVPTRTTYWGVAEVTTPSDCKISIFEVDPTPASRTSHAVIATPERKYRIFQIDVYPWIEIDGHRY